MASLTTILQTINCSLSKSGIRYVGKLEKGQLCKDDLIGTEFAFDLIDSIVGYQVPALGVPSSATITITSDSGGTIQAFVNGLPISTAVVSTGNATNTATALALSINTVLTTPEYTALSANGVVTVYASVAAGHWPNGLDLTVTAASMVVSSTIFSGGTTPYVEIKPVTIFDDAADRLSTVPVKVADVGFQTDTSTIYMANGLSPITWSIITVGIGLENALARQTTAPTAIGQYMVQLDTSIIYRGVGTDAGEWVKYTQVNCASSTSISGSLVRLATINNIVRAAFIASGNVSSASVTATVLTQAQFNQQNGIVVGDYNPFDYNNIDYYT